VLVEAMVRLGARLPFAQVAEEMALLFGVSVSADTVRRLTEEAGAIQVGIEQAELERVEHEAPDEPPGPTAQQVSADGAMVPVVGGSWMEVRTVAIGALEQGGDGMLTAHDLSYFSRCCSAGQFIRQATLPTHERGTRAAETVVAVMDGAPWLQELIDEQCPDAVRIIDFAHAASYLGVAAQAAFGPGSREAAVWLDEWVPTLKRGEPEAVLAALRGLPAAGSEAATAKGTAIRYLGSRLEQLRYAAFRQTGYPIGSGIVESAGKLVVEARLKGSGMHWSVRQLNPVLALRGRLCSGQWTETWTEIARAWRTQMRTRQRAARRRRQAERERKMAEQTAPGCEPVPAPQRAKTIVDGKPTNDHPWKRSPAVAASA
jgi:hypothetical protein